MTGSIEGRLRVLVTRCWGLGGGQVWAEDFSNRLAELGHQVRVIFLRKWWPGMRHLMRNDIMEGTGNRYHPIFLDVPLFFEGCWLTAFLREHLKHGAVDVLVSTGAEGALLKLLRPPGMPPQVASCHHPLAHWVGFSQLMKASCSLSRQGIVRTYHRWDEYLDRLSMGCADTVVCSSKDQADRVVNELKIAKPKVKVIYYGIDTQRLCPRNGQPGSEKRDILFAGGLSSSKGLHVLLEAFAQIRHKFPDATISVVGGGDWSPYHSSVSSLGLSERVRYYGHSLHKDMIKHYRNAYLLAAPTRHESFGLILGEAMACGLPVVATRVTAIPEVVEDGVTGLLVPVDNPSALADALETLLHDPARAAAMGRAGRARVDQHFAWDKVIRQWEHLLFQVAERNLS